MPFKTIRPPAPPTPLPGYSTLCFSGPDAAAFLQAQTMNDVAGLAPGQWHWNGWLTPKGRVVALFALARLGESELLAVLPDFPSLELKALLQRFVFRLKVKMAAEPEWIAGTVWPPENLMLSGHPQGMLLGSPETGLGLVMDMAGPVRVLWLARQDSADTALRPDLSDAWLRADMAIGMPRLSPAQREAWTPQMLSLERLSAYSLGKGCYPGQEIVARTHYLGQARRRLSRIAGTRLEEAATVFDATGAALGTVICATADGTEGLAVIQADFIGNDASVNGLSASLPGFIGAVR